MFDQDILMACFQLADRAGAKSTGLEWTCPHLPHVDDDHHCGRVTWSATAVYQGGRIMSQGHKTGSAAALGLAHRLMAGATCRCRQPVTLSDTEPGCRWKLMGDRWTPGCDAPPIALAASTKRGDMDAITKAMKGKK